jgi:protein-disulfide isomerase
MEFGEYENEDCAKANEVVKQLLEEYEGKIRFNFRHFPLTLVHQRSMKASEAAVAAGQEGKFWKCTMCFSITGVAWEPQV